MNSLVRLLYGTFALWLVQSSPTIAEAVKLTVGTGTEGQGWLFKDPSSGYCGVVTAAHVVTINGVVRTVLINRAGSPQSSPDRGEGVNVMVLSPAPDYSLPEPGKLDVAVMEVIGSIAEHGCTTATLGGTDVSTLLGRPNASVQFDTSREESNSGGELLDLPIRITAQGGGAHIAFTFALAGATQQAGYSGSPIIEALGESRLPHVRLPEAMVTHIDERGFGQALRFDIVRSMVSAYMAGRIRTVAQSAARLAAKKDTNAGGNLAMAAFVEAAGVSYDLTCPPSFAVNVAASCGWRAAPGQGMRAVSIVVAPNGSVTQRVVLSLLPTNGSYDVGIEASGTGDGTDYAPLITRTVAGGQSRFEFLPSQVRKLRILVYSHKNERVEIKVVQVD